MKFISFDLEISKEIPDGETDWKAHRPLGISCAAVAFRPGRTIETHTWNGLEDGRITSQMSRAECVRVVQMLQEWVIDGYTIVTWNGASFDFSILAEESGCYGECANLMLGHVDMMALVVAQKGHFLGLQRAAEGMDIKGKLQEVRLRDGRIHRDMDGAKAPQLWQQGEHEAVLAYLKQDGRVTLELAEAWERTGCMAWLAAGRTKTVHSKLFTVRELLTQPPPYYEPWIKDPKSTLSLILWAAEYHPDLYPPYNNGLPVFWDRLSPAMRTAVRAFLSAAPSAETLRDDHLGRITAYLRYYINAPAWPASDRLTEVQHYVDKASTLPEVVKAVGMVLALGIDPF